MCMFTDEGIEMLNQYGEGLAAKHECIVLIDKIQLLFNNGIDERALDYIERQAK